jgi:GntR family negative regulator for fad regulon and positive regulator of fabA
MSEQKEERATDRVERQLIEKIVSGMYPPHTDLPGERVLCNDLHIARPALREAMQRLSRDGWLDIQQGKPTRIRDYLKDGNLNILAGLLKADPDLVPNLVPDLLDMWQLLAPQYTASTVRRAPGLILDLLEGFSRLADEPETYAQNMWRLHHLLIAYCDNLVYGLIFNTFRDFYRQLASYYYTTPGHREAARKLWRELAASVEALDTGKAAQLVTGFITGTAEFWSDVTYEQYQQEVLEDSPQDPSQKKKKAPEHPPREKDRVKKKPQ